MATSVDAKEQLRGKRFICLARQSDDSQGTTSTQAQLEYLKQEGAALGMIYVDAVLLHGVTDQGISPEGEA